MLTYPYIFTQPIRSPSHYIFTSPQALAFAFAFGTASGTLPCGLSPTPMPGRLGPMGSLPMGSPKNAKDLIFSPWNILGCMLNLGDCQPPKSECHGGKATPHRWGCCRRSPGPAQVPWNIKVTWKFIKQQKIQKCVWKENLPLGRCLGRIPPFWGHIYIYAPWGSECPNHHSRWSRSLTVQDGPQVLPRCRVICPSCATDKLLMQGVVMSPSHYLIVCHGAHDQTHCHCPEMILKD